MLRLLLPFLLSFPAFAGVETLIDRASDGDLPREQRQAAFDELVRTGYGAELITLAEDSETDARQRWVIIRAIGKIDSPPGREALVRLLRDDISGIRAAAAMALGDSEDHSHAEAIAGLLEDPAVIVRASAADALAQLGASEAVPYLIRALDDPSNFYRGDSLWVRRHYVVALGACNDRAALPALMRCLDDADPHMVDAALVALEQVSGVSWADGRDRREQIEAWKRWWSNQK
jgi:HEAT repeat protein